MEVFSQESSHTHKLEYVSMEIESPLIRSHYKQNKDMDAIIQGFKALVASKGSKRLSWKMLYNIKMPWIDISAFHELSVLVPFNELKMIQHLRDLTVSNCDSLVEVFESGEEGGTTKRDAMIHYQLQTMTLGNLPKLSHIWKHKNIMEVVSFRKLESIYVSGCHSLKSLISHSMARSLDQLQQINVMLCEMMEVILTKEDNDTTQGGEGEKHKILFPKLNPLKLWYLPNLECFCSGYFDYDIPLCDVNVEEDTKMNHNNDDKVQISFPQLNLLSFIKVPKLKCFCSGEYDYNIIDYSSTQECQNILTFPLKRGNLIVNTPSLLSVVEISFSRLHTHGNPNLTIHYIQNSDKYKAELRKLKTFIGIEQDEALYGYIKRETKLKINKCHKLLNCIPSNMTLLFLHVTQLIVQECEGLEEIFESNDSIVKYEPSASLPQLKHIPKVPSHILGLQNLEKIYIRQCDELKYVFPDVSMATSLSNLKYLEVYMNARRWRRSSGVL